MENSARLAEAVEQASLEQEVLIHKLNDKLAEYDQLDNLLSTFTDKRIHEAMIPLSKIAFCPGRFVNTNDITAFLGADHFAVVSAKTARKLVDHRKTMIRDQIVKQEQATDLINQRKGKLEEIDEDLIKEELTEADEAIIEAQENRSARPTNDEIIAQMAEKLRRTKLKSDEEVWEEISSERKQKPKIETEPNIHQIQDTKEEHRKHSVHFEEESTDDDESIVAPLSLKFVFSSVKSTAKYSDDGSYSTPWDIENNYKNKMNRSILKNPRKTTPLDFGQSGCAAISSPIPRIPPKRQNSAFSEEVHERKVDPVAYKLPTKSKATSLFKQRRLRS